MAQSGEAEYGATVLEEVIVTAQKREQSLQDVPISVTAFGAEDIAFRGITDTMEIGQYVPNLVMTPQPGTSATSSIMTIRGAGVNDLIITNDQAVSDARIWS